ncbi:MAG: DDE-type integrase/transposase/recombinase, partial [Verrucomicrobiales bacterium]|nr:DDE-type integrase/transposase/recombinase [Verrucomicrobiales bacterium]
MKRIPVYLKMRVLGALEYAEGETLKDRYKAVAAMTFKDEDGHAYQFTWRTIQTWWYWYRHHGMVAAPQRSDKGTTRKVDPGELLSAIEKVMPTFRRAPANVTAIYRVCIEQGHLRRDQVAETTFRRIVKQFELLKDVEGMTDGPAKRVRLAFAKAQANEMWQGDTLHGPYIKIEGRAMKTYLLCFIDDASRVIPHGQFYLADSTTHLIDCFQTALFKRGVPKSMYVDNGSNYSSKEFSLISARLGIQLIHTPVRDGAAKGKIERFFRTVRDQFLLRNLSEVGTLKELNSQFINWVEDNFHQREHTTLRMKPIDRFGMDLNGLRYLTPSPYNKELFYIEETRKVRTDNTFNLKGVRYEAPRDLRHTKIEVRFDRNDPSVLP